MRILELSDEPYFRDNATSSTRVDFFQTTGKPQTGLPEHLTMARFTALKKEVQSGQYDLIACSPKLTPLWRPDRDLFRNTASFLKNLRRFHTLSLSLLPLLRGASKTPLLVYNRKDSPVMPRQNFPLLHMCDRYFIRELPQNNWNVFLMSTAKNEEVVNMIRQPLLSENIHKFRPLPLGYLDTLERHFTPNPTKTTDIFYAGKSHTTTVRARGLLALQKMKQLGFRVDLPENPLPKDEFLQRCAQSHLVWSPEGLGWDCNRHYESLLVGSVPLINYPTIERYKPLVHGEHCLFYGVEGDYLIETARAALADAKKLRQIATQGRDYVLTWHRHDKLVQYMIEETLSAKR